LRSGEPVEHVLDHGAPALTGDEPPLRLAAG
jgi:hypothetical protein